uniref:Uncharacterized protein LOC114331702 n=1 Tax=Diabrotica virgifera virgifera TaxID=50390 RepID=A0A6P7FW32_DIAVI
IKCIADEIKLFNVPNKLAPGKVFTKVADTVCRNIYQAVKPSKTVRNSLTHGDIWTNNILIKYDKKSNKPIGCKLVDFQVGKYAPPAQTVLAFLYLNTRRDFRKKYLYELVGMYYSFLEKDLKKSDIKIDSILPFTEFLQSCDEQKLFGVLISAFYFPLVLINADEIETYFSNAELNRKALFENRIHLVLAHKGKDTAYDERLRESIEDLKELCELF